MQLSDYQVITCGFFSYLIIQIPADPKEVINLSSILTHNAPI